MIVQFSAGLRYTKAFENLHYGTYQMTTTLRTLKTLQGT